MEKSEILNNKFQYLVENAFDFLEQSIVDLQNKPKYSVIHFHAAIELFLKARLMAEHWSLVVSSKREADWDLFQKGDFLSVSLDESVKKLDKIVQSSLSDDAFKAFKNITRHRNQMVHFYHEPETIKIKGQTVQKIVKEQFTAWYYLHDLLLKQWKDIFIEWEDRILKIGRELKKHHVFLQVKYDEVKPHIQKLIADGNKCYKCPSCNFDSDIHADIKDHIYDSECLVCDLSQSCIVIDCKQCSNGTVIYQGKPNAICNQCEHLFDGTDLKEKFIDENAIHLAIKEGECSYFPIHCGVCSGYETVIEISENELLCTECFDMPDSYGVCEWCNEESTHLSEETYAMGCEFCDGRMGWEKD